MLPSNTTRPRLGRVVFAILENDPPPNGIHFPEICVPFSGFCATR